MPSSCSGQPRIPVNGVTPSLIIIRIWGSDNVEHSRTEVNVKYQQWFHAGIEQEKHTLELHIRRERCKLGDLERPIGWYMIGRKRSRSGEIGEI
jgi:hypothetical protein